MTWTGPNDAPLSTSSERLNRFKCKKCGGAMKASKAIQNTVVASPDFPGDTGKERGCTLNYGGPGKLIDCLKCEKCGWSVTTARQGEVK